VQSAISRRASGSRLIYLDWLRGLAVLMMILWHVADSWTTTDGRGSALFQAVGFTGGWAAPLFLLLAGVSVPLAGAARMARGATRAQAAWALQKRGWLVFALAHLFRLQSFILNPSGTWNSLLKPDILNILGLGLVLTAWLWGRGNTSWQSQLAWLVSPALAVIVVVSPLAPTWWWPTLLHPRLEAYIRPVGNYGVFSLFPAVAYVLFGGYAGDRLSQAGAAMGRFHGRLAVAGGAALALSWILSDSHLASAGMWVNPISAVSVRVGTMFLLMAYAWWAFRRWPAGRYSRMALLGQTSLFVYWVHVELVYGTFSFAVRQRLPLAWSLLGYVLVVAGMYGLAVLWSQRSRGPIVPEHMAAPLAVHPFRATVFHSR